MKKSNSILAMVAMAILVTTVAIVSCKKETDNALNQRRNNTQRTVDISQIDDMTAYFKDFRRKMTGSRGDEAMNIEDAAWHLASLANIDYCRVNVEYNEVEFDTIEMQVNVMDGIMLISDINLAYNQMCAEIQQFKKDFNHYDQNLYFINVFINGNGIAKIALMTSYTSLSRDLDDHHWYFPETFYFSMDSVCDLYFNNSTQYSWDSIARDQLNRILNFYEHHTNTPDVISYIPTRNHTFEYPNYPDSYGSPFLDNSRVFAGDVCVGGTFILTLNEMCYCLDSYLGLGYDYIDDNLYENEHPVSWVITPAYTHFSNHKWPTRYHKLAVQYGQLYSNNNQPNPD